MDILKDKMLKFISCRSTLCEICLGKLTTIKKAKDKDVEAVELYALKGNRDNIADERWSCN
jgi:SecD/SecF fusion protein